MQKNELRRLHLIALIDSIGHGGISKVAMEIGKEASYVSRMLYEPGKAGGKPVTERTADLLDEAFPDWQRKSETVSVTPQLSALRCVDTAPKVNIEALNAIERLKLALNRKQLPPDALGLLVNDIEAKLMWVKKTMAKPAPKKKKD